MVGAVVALWLAMIGCAGDGADTAATAPIPEMEPMALLTRASLELRGVRPSLDDQAELEADPEQLDALIETYLQDERFGDQMGHLFSEIYRTRIPQYSFQAVRFGVSGSDTHRFHDSVGDEPLRVLGHIAQNDLPWTELVTGDWTMINELLAPAWPTDYPLEAVEAGEVEPGWKKVQYTDGRPAAGVLATSSLWNTYPSTLPNANRKRANAVSRIFLCQDYLSKLIDFDDSANILTDAAVQDAIQTDPNCVSCHVVLEPLASFFYGFWIYNPEHPTDVTHYHAEREQTWRDITGVAPGYFGEPGWTLGDLGQLIAADARFTECVTEQVFELLLSRESDLSDFSDLSAHRDDFIEGGLTMRSLVRSVMASPLYRAGDTDDPRATPLKMASPYALASQIEDLTGFSWWNGGTDMMRFDGVGVRTLAGGVDGYDVVAPRRSPNPSVLLVQERLAELSSWHVASADAALTDLSARRLFVAASMTETPETDPAAMAAQVQHLHWRLFAERVDADGEEVAAALALWSALYDYSGDPVQAWAGVLSALLRDPRILFY